VTQLKWITAAMATAIHEEAIYEFGGLPGVRDAGLLESALDRPRNQQAYDPESSIFRLAAVLCSGIARNHAFNDGNKRTALLVSRAFLYLNGHALEPREDDEVACLVAIAAGAMDDEAIDDWLKQNSTAMD
jgi:death-on-curing protein